MKPESGGSHDFDEGLEPADCQPLGTQNLQNGKGGALPARMNDFSFLLPSIMGTDKRDLSPSSTGMGPVAWDFLNARAYQDFSEYGRGLSFQASFSSRALTGGHVERT